MNLGSLTITGNKFRLSCVYEFISNGKVMYVGYSARGFSRAFRGYSNGVPQPSAKRRVMAFNQADQIRVTVFDSTDEAKQEEIRLIQLHNPVANTNHRTK